MLNPFLPQSIHKFRVAAHHHSPFLRTIYHSTSPHQYHRAIRKAPEPAVSFSSAPTKLAQTSTRLSSSSQTPPLPHKHEHRPTNPSPFLLAFLAQVPLPPPPPRRPPPPPPSKHTHTHHHHNPNMASDEDYGAFLDKANQDTGASTQPKSSTSKPSTKAVDTEIPASLQKIEAYYTSEADEPFEPVSLSWKGEAMPSERKFPSLLFHPCP